MRCGLILTAISRTFLESDVLCSSLKYYWYLFIYLFHIQSTEEIKLNFRLHLGNLTNLFLSALEHQSRKTDVISRDDSHVKLLR